MIKKILSEKKLYSLTISVLFIPIFVSFSLIYLKEKKLEDKAYMIQLIGQKAKTNYLLRSSVKDFLQIHKNSDQEYIENTLETLSFLQDEVQSLKPLLNHPAFQNSISQDRYKQLSTQNRLCFTEDQPKANKTCKETSLRQKDPIEVDKKDLATILQLIEEEKEKKPQLIIHNFSLEKTNNETVFLTLDLLKRTFN